MRLRTKAILIILLIILMAAAGLVSCSPGKKLVKGQEALETIAKLQADHDQQVAAKAVNDFVKNNPCSPVPEINLDSLCSLYYQCPDAGNHSPAEDYSAGPVAPDQATPGTWRPAGIGWPKTVLVPWEDKRSINLLRDSITEKNKRLAVLQALIGTKDSECIATVKKVADDQHQAKKTLWYAIGILGLLLLAAVYVIVKRPKIFS